jgi:hypothetical protein
MTTIRTVIRTAAIMAATASLVMISTQYAGASTSHEFVYHADRAVAGEVWFNSGNHAAHAGHAKHGFNSFTIKDRFCGDGWGMGVQWRIGGNEFNYQTDGDCEPVEIPAYQTGQASSVVIEFDWRPYMWSVNWPHDTEYGDWNTDWMGSYSEDRTSRFFEKTSVHNDVLGEGRTFTATMWPTAEARWAGGDATEEMWRELQERTPLPSTLTGAQRESLRMQLWCHAAFGKHPMFGGETWEIESNRRPLTIEQVWIVGLAMKCNW